MIKLTNSQNAHKQCVFFQSDLNLLVPLTILMATLCVGLSQEIENYTVGGS